MENYRELLYPEITQEEIELNIYNNLMYMQNG